MSNLFSLDYKDILKGLSIAVGAAVLTAVSGDTIPPVATILMVAKSAGVAYLLKNFFTNSTNQFGKGDPMPNKTLPTAKVAPAAAKSAAPVADQASASPAASPELESAPSRGTQL